MARKRSFFRQMQRDAYLVQRASGDIAAAERGPGPYAKRRLRRVLTRSIFRGFGL